MKDTQRRFTLDELSGLVSLSRRTVRYYIQMALVDRPLGVGRGAHYDTRHLNQLLEIRKWQDAGLSLERIRELLRASDTNPPPVPPRQPGAVEIWSQVLIDEGIELHINPERAKLTPEETREFVATVMDLYQPFSLAQET